MEDLATDLITLKYDVERRRTAAERLARVRDTLAAERKRVLDLREQLQFEQGDVERLEGMSFARFIATLRGVREERLEKERGEYVAAKLKYDGSVEATAALEAQIAALEAEIVSLADAEARYDATLAAREERLLGDGATGHRVLRELTDELGTLRATLRELDEAEVAARDAGNALVEVAKLLGKASDWGSVDMLGGGLIATALKHDRIEQANTAAGRARQALQRLATELSDVGMRAAGVDVEIGTFSATADYLFDGYFADARVQKRIEEAQARVDHAVTEVRTLWNQVRDAIVQARERSEALELKRRTYLEQF